MWKLGKLWTVLRSQLALAWLTLRDPRTPWSARLVIVLAVAYVLSPIDLVSDFIPFLGWIDDGVVAALLLKLAMRFVPADLHAALAAKVAQRQARPRA